MRMQKEEKIVVVLLLMALGSLAVAFWAFSPEEGPDEGTSAKKDAGLTQEGIVLEVKPTKSGGHLILKLDSTQTPIFVSREAGATEIGKGLNPGDRIRLKGRLMEYEGNDEIRVDRAENIEIVDEV
ncbi:MAG: hypothetical protein PHW87_01930 [Methanothrix sp.]|nr:hypothetical protein [Methanothrix sp.]